MNVTRLFSAEFQPDSLMRDEEPKAEKELPNVDSYRLRIDDAEGFSGVWEIIKDTVKFSLGTHRLGMLLFLDDLPLHLGAYHQLGTNNIVLNRSLVNIVEAVTKSKKLVNAFVYSILTHEYLHALGTFQRLKFVLWFMMFPENVSGKIIYLQCWLRRLLGC